MHNPTVSLSPQQRQFLAEFGNLFVLFRIKMTATTAGTCPDDAAVVAEGRSANKPISIEKVVQNE